MTHRNPGNFGEHLGLLYQAVAEGFTKLTFTHALGLSSNATFLGRPTLNFPFLWDWKFKYKPVVESCGMK